MQNYGKIARFDELVHAIEKNILMMGTKLK